MNKKYFKIVDEETIYSNGKVLKTEIEIDGKIRKVTIVNPTEQQMLDAGWQLVPEPELTEEELLAQAKADKIAQIENYDASSEVEEFLINDNPMWLGHELRQQIRTSADAYEALGAETMTKVFNGMEFTFSIPMWKQMLNALEVYAAEALNTTERHKNAISAMTNIQDVIDYDYTTGYPLKLSFGQNDN